MIAVAFLLLLSSAYAAQTTKQPDERNIRSTELPAALQSTIKSTYGTYWITGLTENGTAKHARYTLTLENADQVLQLRAGKGNQWEVVSTEPRVE